MKNFGFTPSKLDGTEVTFKEDNKMKMPLQYTYQNNLSKILNQGSKPICVPCSISAYINWDINMNQKTNNIDYNVNLESIYKSKTTKGDDGMTFKDAFTFIRNKGVQTNKGLYKIGKYFKIGSILQLQQAIIVNGPCFGALPVYSERYDDFWTKTSDGLLGGHAISIVGYNKEGFIIRNSWGTSYGDKGYGLLEYNDFKLFYEIWTVV